ncbi:hypothetical protein Hsero_0058 [Herbaspirillum seropedicae SmR1]|uniref:Uncharacterized protein n=1 Tax=Herbaspirillum seropedicae (strain SmR1) TaxID=757424 RepID=D8ITU7_HERSS|nr:hypothetical protein Hsero_0058 [Herbaspirillum seropedicae SmR1]
MSRLRTRPRRRPRFPPQTLTQTGFHGYTAGAYGYAVIEFFFPPCPLYTPNE